MFRSLSLSGSETVQKSNGLTNEIQIYRQSSQDNCCYIAREKCKHRLGRSRHLLQHSYQTHTLHIFHLRWIVSCVGPGIVFRADVENKGLRILCPTQTKVITTIKLSYQRRSSVKNETVIEKQYHKTTETVLRINTDTVTPHQHISVINNLFLLTFIKTLFN